MAKNLRTKTPESDTVVIHDVNPTACESLAKEIGNVEIAKNVREVAEKAVCRTKFQNTMLCFSLFSRSHIVLSMI